MLFNPNETRNPIDRERVVGQPVPRLDGPLKTSGTARYAYERHDLAPDAAYGYPVGATIPKGTILSIDVDRARAEPGVLAIITALDHSDLGKGEMNVAQLFGGPSIQHYHQAIAVVVAESFEQARSAASLIDVRYKEDERAVFELRAVRAAFDNSEVDPEMAIGDFEAAFAGAAVTVDAEYSTPDQSHAAMEPHATLASWEGDHLTIWTSNQMITFGKQALVDTFGLDPANVRIVAPFVGGGFGGKLYVRADAILAALAAREVGRPVKLALPRPLIANNTTHRAATLQRIRLGADIDGRLVAVGHDCFSANLPGGRPENGTAQTPHLYASETMLVVNRLGMIDLPEGSDMRAPGEAPGLMALEIAMDELAEKLAMDPVDLRVLNDARTLPDNVEQPYVDRHLRRCLEMGAERFGWARRAKTPGRVREGQWLVGLGMAAGFRGNFIAPSGARVTLSAAGTVHVETDMTDIGTGSYTIIAQTAAEMLGLPLDRVAVSLADSNFPSAWGSGGQAGANSSTAGVYAACIALRRMIGQQLGIDPDTMTLADGTVALDGSKIPIGQAAADGDLVAEDRMEYDRSRWGQHYATYAAHFSEVAVHAATGEVRVRRLLAVCDAGRIINPITAHSQVIGAMTMGVGAALMEELVVDHRRGFFVNHDLAGYEVPVHADIGDMEVIFIDEPSAASSPLKGKGVGELGLCGVSAAVANAVYNATGVRVRDYPITLDKFIAGLPPV